MKRIWSFLAMLFAGFAAGLVTMYKLMGDQIEINIKRIKTKKGVSNVSVPIDLRNAENGELSKRQRRKRKKKQKDG